MSSSFAELFGGSGATGRALVYCSQSQTVTARADGFLVLRCMGAAGSGARGSFATGGTAGTVGAKTVRVNAGDQFIITVPAGGAAQAGANTNGNAGGTLTITGPGVNISIPGGTGGVQGVASAKAALAAVPTGLDWYILGGRGGVASAAAGCTGGGAAALLGVRSYDSGDVANTQSGGAGVGGSSTGIAGGGSGGPGGASGGPNLLGQLATANALSADTHSVLLVNVSGGADPAVNGPGGSGAGGSATATGHGGFGGGGGAGVSTGSGNGGRGGGGGANNGAGTASGSGGAAFVTCEFLEVLQ